MPAREVRQTKRSPRRLPADALTAAPTRGGRGWWHVHHLSSPPPRAGHAGPRRAAARARPRSSRGSGLDPPRPAARGRLPRRLLCLWDLTASGYSNTYYAAAARAGSESWKAWFFGSLGPGELHHGRQAAAVAVADGPVGAGPRLLLVQRAAAAGAVHGRRRWRCCTRRSGACSGRPPGVFAAAVLAITPVTVAIGRVDNPDALLVLLMVASAWAIVRALERGRTRFARARGRRSSGSRS